ncbi:hypoxanthine phosphoribosyltransferase [bacterium]|nr:MAG: hypoxanthine phosphoribosyltransferase [bacterium]
MDQFRPVLSAEQIEKRIGELGTRITEDYGDEYPLFIGVLKGAFIFLADLVRAIGIPVEIDFAQISSYGDETKSSGRIKILRDISSPITDRHVVVVEDIIDTGRTLHHYIEHLKARGPKSVKICALINKPERQEFTPEVDYLGFQIPKGFLVGYGLDWAGKYRDLPGVYEVPEE